MRRISGFMASVDPLISNYKESGPDATLAEQSNGWSTTARLLSGLRPDVPGVGVIQCNCRVARAWTQASVPDWARACACSFCCTLWSRRTWRISSSPESTQFHQSPSWQDRRQSPFLVLDITSRQAVALSLLRPRRPWPFRVARHGMHCKEVRLERQTVRLGAMFTERFSGGLQDRTVLRDRVAAQAEEKWRPRISNTWPPGGRRSRRARRSGTLRPSNRGEFPWRDTCLICGLRNWAIAMCREGTVFRDWGTKRLE